MRALFAAKKRPVNEPGQLLSLELKQRGRIEHGVQFVVGPPLGSRCFTYRRSIYQLCVDDEHLLRLLAAAFAASMASSMSFGDAVASVVMTSSVVGLDVGMDFPPSASRHLPLMKSCPGLMSTGVGRPFVPACGGAVTAMENGSFQI